MIAALPELGDGEVDSADARLPIAMPVAVALSDALGAPLAVGGTDA